MILSYEKATKKFLSTLSLRRATVVGDVMGKALAISIHALLAESDAWVIIVSVLVWHFYPRSPCGERQPHEQKTKGHHSVFLSTLSLRRATKALIILSEKFYYFYPRSPCGERQDTPLISIPKPGFLSTLSLRRATVEEVSGDTWMRDFYPRSPCGERHHTNLPSKIIKKFLSTLSLRRATPGIIWSTAFA